MILLAVAGLTVALIVLFSTSSGGKKETVKFKEGNTQTAPAENQMSSQTKEFKDPSGFNFSYPDNLTLEKKDAVNSQTYSFLELTSSDDSGKVTIDVSGTEIASLNEALKQNKAPATAQVKTLKLGDMDARQYEAQNQIVTLAIDTGVLFTIKTDLGSQKNFWSSVNDKITSSFVLAPPEAPVDNSSSYSEDDSIIDEGEEIIE